MKKLVVVSGANGDIGRPLVDTLVRKGYSVAAVVRDFSKIDNLYESDVAYFNCNFSDEVSILECTKKIKSQYKSIFGVVNCVGIAHGAGFMMAKMDDMKSVFDINYFSVLLFTQQLVRKMLKAKDGSIVNLASTAGILSDKGTIAYGASKAALIHSTKVMATELGTFGVRANAIAPSVIESKMSEAMDIESINSLNYRASIKSIIEPQEVVETIVFLLSEHSKNITGQVIKVDRGITE